MQAHEVLLQRPTFLIAEALSRSERLPAARLRELQLTKLRRLVAHASEECPHYSAQCLPSPDSIRDLHDFSAIDLLTRDDMRRFGWRMCWSNAPCRLLIGHTHGSADDPLAFFWDRRRQAWDKANRLRAHRWHGFTPGDRELHLWPLDPSHSWHGRLKQWLRERRDDLFGELQIDSLHTFNERLPLTWRAWREFDPVRVTAYPSALAQLIVEGRRVGCRIGNPSLQSVFLTGEVTFDWQRKLIERELGVPTMQDYGIQEVGALAYACPSGSWHISAESALVEIVRDGRPARPGEYGEIVVTGLESLAMPVLRYCTGDIVRVPEDWSRLAGVAEDSRSDGRTHDAAVITAPPRPVSIGSRLGSGFSAHPASSACRCGRTLPILPPVVGRAADFLESPSGTWIEPARVVSALGTILETGTYQVMQAKDGNVAVLVVTTPTQAAGRQMPANWEQAVRECVENLLGSGVRCDVKRAPSLTRSLFGKCRYVASDRTAGGLARR
jgi:phenylacetate-CoA ligase